MNNPFNNFRLEVNNPINNSRLEINNPFNNSRLEINNPFNNSRLDLQTDGVLNLCEYCSPCTRNLEYAATIQTSARIFQIVEPELVPAVLQVQGFEDRLLTTQHQIANLLLLISSFHSIMFYFLYLYF